MAGHKETATHTPAQADELERLREELERTKAACAVCQQHVGALRESEEKYRVLLDESSDPIFSIQPDGEYVYVNRAFADGVGRRQEEIIGHRIWDVFSPDEAEKRFSVVRWVIDNRETKKFEVRVPRPDQDRYYITTVKPHFNELGEVVWVICISKEITERKHMERDLLHLSTHDLLTGLYNRNFYEVEMERIEHSRLYPVSIVVADMDNLKAVNDREGHSAGDRLIRRVADILRQTFRAEDIIARIGGDEFAVLLPQTHEADARAMVDRLVQKLSQDMAQPLRLSIGLASSEAGLILQDVMRLADDRMYQEKSQRKFKPAVQNAEIPQPND